MNFESDIEYHDLLKQIKKDGMSAMLPMYRLHREKYLSFTSQYTTDRDLRLQSYNDAIVNAYRAIVKSSYDPKKSKLKTFIFNIGKNNLINRLEKENTYTKHISFENTDKEADVEVPFSDSSPKQNEKWNKDLSLGFDQLGEKCRELILYFYYDRLDTEEIMKLMNYDSSGVVYSAKSRCLKRLRELIINSRERT